MATKKAAKKAAKKAMKKVVKKGAPEKKPEDYLTSRPGSIVSLKDYIQKPGISFLTQVVEAKNTFDYCSSKFPKYKKSTKLTQEGLDNLQYVTGALFPLVMGHFETFQKCLFAGLFEATRFMPDWDPEKQAKKLGTIVNLSPTRMAAHRGEPASVGIVLADAIGGWHSPTRVNDYFKCFDSNLEFFTDSQAAHLKVLWQIRHSLVHTGGWLSAPDAQKVTRLIKYGDTALAFNENFALAFTKMMHRIVKESVERLEKKLRPRLRTNLNASEQQEFDDLLKVDSPSSSFFPK